MTGGRRAITLIELLIVLAVALALSAVSLRSALSWSDEDRLDAVVSGLSSAALEARSVALRRMLPVELVAERAEPGVFRVGIVNVGTSDGLLDEVEVMSVLYELPEDLSIVSGEGIIESGGRVALLRLRPDGAAELAGEGWTLTQGEMVYTPTVGAWTARLTFAVTSKEEVATDFEPASAEAGQP